MPLSNSGITVSILSLQRGRQLIFIWREKKNVNKTSSYFKSSTNINENSVKQRKKEFKKATMSDINLRDNEKIDFVTADYIFASGSSANERESVWKVPVKNY